ncbi:receptor-like protein EIX2 [Citrus clementina]|uniref:receptor-like protein EIX2 n=1 Tax=Citrus clementina TaxID=85681 RepID=UPI000CED3B84|nr:receptor-like protein EIX2 [Citrus x clementina]
MTGHVLHLDLRNPFNCYKESEYDAIGRTALVGKINPSLLDLKHLSYLDLSFNDFQGVQIPRFVGSMGNLRYLNLSRTRISGMIPHQLGNLSNLQFLGLSSNYLLYVDNLLWLSGLSSLEHLDLRSVNLSKAFDWLMVTNELPSLVELRLSNCQLHHFSPLATANFSSLTVLDLSHNQFDNSFIPSWVFGLSHLLFLDLGFNHFQGPIPGGLQNLTSLKHLGLDSNYFNSSIPNWLYRFIHLEYLSLRNNKLQGTIDSEALGNLTSISRLDLSLNTGLEGRIPRSMASLCNLKSINLRGVHLSQEISEILNIFSGCVSIELESLDLRSSSISGHLTDQLGQFKNLDNLDLANNSIVGPIPQSLGHLSNLRVLQIYNNKLNGTLSEIHFSNLTKLSWFRVGGNKLTLEVRHDWIPPFQLVALGFHNCYVGSRFPQWLHSQKHLQYLNLLNSGMSDLFPIRFLKSAFQLKFLDLGLNQFHGQITDLTKNQRAKELNRLSGTIPVSLKKCTALESLDVGENEFVGNIPTWTGERFSRMVVLILRSNNFHGPLPTRLCDLAFLQILDLADNNLFGTIPKCINNITGMVAANSFTRSSQQYLPLPLDGDVILTEKASVVSEGEAIEYDEILNLVKETDVSRNNLTKNIPLEMTNLKATQSLNFSHNSFTGRIPESIGAMRSLESIDFSVNQLSGEIPQSMSNLMSLNHLNLSNNKLTGKIPSSTQLQSFDASSFTGNDLCGAPLPKNCAENVSVSEDENGDEDEDEVDHWLYVTFSETSFVYFHFGHIQLRSILIGGLRNEKLEALVGSLEDYPNFSPEDPKFKFEILCLRTLLCSEFYVLKLQEVFLILFAGIIGTDHVSQLPKAKVLA